MSLAPLLTDVEIASAEYRKDPFSDAWVVIATDRSKRPEEFRQSPWRRVELPCPFCAGREFETPPEIARYPATDAWQVRVVPNKFPAVRRRRSGDVSELHESADASELFESRFADGVHDLVIESPDHRVGFNDVSLAHTTWMFQAYRDRMATLAAEGRWSYVQAFKNVGPAAGSSVEHTHSQLMALPTAPTRVVVEMAKSSEYFGRHRRSIFADLIAEEEARGARIVAATDDFVALCPWASRVPFETWVIPRDTAKRQDRARFDRAEDSQLAELARIMRDLIGRVDRALDHPAYNYVVHTAPFDSGSCDHYDWHLELFPRMTTQAGFEWGAGHFINPVSPEAAAARLRDA